MKKKGGWFLKFTVQKWLGHLEIVDLSVHTDGQKFFSYFSWFLPRTNQRLTSSEHQVSQRASVPFGGLQSWIHRVLRAAFPCIPVHLVALYQLLSARLAFSFLVIAGIYKGKKSCKKYREPFVEQLKLWLLSPPLPVPPFALFRSQAQPCDSVHDSTVYKDPSQNWRLMLTDEVSVDPSFSV